MNIKFSDPISAKDIRNGNVKLPAEPGLYKWWFPKKDAEMLLIPLLSAGLDCQNIEKMKIPAGKLFGGEYWALYLGKAEDEPLSKRILRQHIGGNRKGSTLRKTISALLIELGLDGAENRINEIIDRAYVQTCALQDKVGEEENCCINDGYFPLNIKSNKEELKAVTDKLSSLRSKV